MRTLHTVSKLSATCLSANFVNMFLGSDLALIKTYYFVGTYCSKENLYKFLNYECLLNTFSLCLKFFNTFFSEKVFSFLMRVNLFQNKNYVN